MALELTYTANQIHKLLHCRVTTITEAMDAWTQSQGARGLAYFYMGKVRRVRESRLKAWIEGRELETAAG